MPFSISLALGIFLLGLGTGALLTWVHWTSAKRRLLDDISEHVRRSLAEDARTGTSLEHSEKKKKAS
jgi:hypothetical protein